MCIGCAPAILRRNDDLKGASALVNARGLSDGLRMTDTPAKPCCAPSRSLGRATQLPDLPSGKPARDCVEIPGGAGWIGTDHPGIPADCESPLKRTKIRKFWMERGTVTTTQFAQFITETGYATEAERLGWSFVFASQVPESIGRTESVPGVPWWRRVDGANWCAPFGPGTEPPDPDTHPVTQISWNDARAYALWAGGRLPSEAEWEHAARGGQSDVPYSWGMVHPGDGGPYPCNIWQGHFPDHNTAADGFDGTAPTLSFDANSYGVFNMLGNVWEWTAEPFRLPSLKREIKARAAQMRGYKLLKGGSYLCHVSYCYRYRIAARMGNSPDSTTTHQGLRLVYDEPPQP